MYFLPNEKSVVSTHAHYKCSSDGYLARLINLGMTDEVFELSHTNISFATGCGHRNYVDFSMLVIWMSGRGYQTERNY